MYLGHLRIWSWLCCSICGFVCLTPPRRNLQIRGGQVGTSARPYTSDLLRTWVHTVSMVSIYMYGRYLLLRKEDGHAQRLGLYLPTFPCSSSLYELQYTCRVYCQLLRFGAKNSTLIEKSDKERTKGGAVLAKRSAHLRIGWRRKRNQEIIQSTPILVASSSPGTFSACMPELST